MRIRIFPLSLIAFLAVCSTPGEPCACPPATTQAIIYGRVTRADPRDQLAGIRVETVLFQGACSSVVTRPTGQGVAFTNDAGIYHLEVRSFLGTAQPACAETAADLGADTVGGPRVTLVLRGSKPLDSARVDIALPSVRKSAYVAQRSP